MRSDGPSMAQARRLRGAARPHGSRRHRGLLTLTTYLVMTGHWPLSGFGFACACTFVGFLFDLILTSVGGHAAPCFRVGLWVSRSSVGGGQSMAGLGTSQVLEASLCRACGQGRM